MNQFQHPQNNIAEITLLGTGGGYGESCLIHLGNRKWIIIDSCKNPHNDTVIPLEYLLKLGVDLETEVVQIIATHWHDDHIAGLSKIYECCVSSSLVIAPTLDLTKFLMLVGLDYQKLKVTPSISSTIEFNECLRIIEERGSTPKYAISDKVLFKSYINGNIVEASSLSPSDQAIREYDDEISTLIKQFGPPTKRIIINSPNIKSIVLYVKFGEHRALLGADLENSIDPQKGWEPIFGSNIIDKPASYFKVPHHGSGTAYNKRVWAELLKQNPTASISAWKRQVFLPSEDMIEIFRGYTDNIYLTTTTYPNSPKKRDKNVEKMIREVGNRITEIKYNLGIVRAQIDILDPQSEWIVETYPPAHKII